MNDDRHLTRIIERGWARAAARGPYNESERQRNLDEYLERL